MSEIRSEKAEKMSEVMWISERMQNDIAPPTMSSHVGERIRHAAHEMRIKYSRAKGYWYLDERIDPKPREHRRIKELTGLEYDGHKELRETDELILKAQAILDSNATGADRAMANALRAFLGSFDRP